MENRAIRDYQITASSVWSVRHGAANGRLNFKAGGGRTGAWSTRTLNGYQWLQVDFRQRATVAEIITQGRQDYNQWVKSYSVWYSNNGRNFWPYRQNGRTKVWLRVHAVTWQSFQTSGGSKVERCGLVNVVVPAPPYHPPLRVHEACTHRFLGPKFTLANWDRMTFKESWKLHEVDAVGHWKTLMGIELKILVSQIVFFFLFFLNERKIFRGNSDRNSIVRQTISPAIVARFIRIRPLTWHGFISMRVEFLGCIKGKQ